MGESRLTLRMRKQLNGLYIGVRVDYAAGHIGTSIRLFGRNFTQLRHKETQQQRVKNKPACQWQHHTPVGTANNDKHPQKIDDDIVHYFNKGHDALAQGERGLHQLGGDPAGKLILVVAHGLFHQVAVAQPADTHGEVAKQCLVGQ